MWKIETNLLCWFQCCSDNTTFANAVEAVPNSSICHLRNHLVQKTQFLLEMPPEKLSGTRRKRSVGHMVQKRKEAFLCMCCSSNSTSWTGLLISFEFIVSVRPNSFAATPTYTCQQFPMFIFSGRYGILNKSGAAYNQLLMHWHLYHMLTTEKLKRTQFQFFRY